MALRFGLLFLLISSLAYLRWRILPPAASPAEGDASLRELLLDANHTADDSLAVAFAKVVERPGAAPAKDDPSAKLPPTIPEHVDPELISRMPDDIRALVQEEFPNPERIGQALIRQVKNIAPDDVAARTDVAKLAEVPGLVAPELLVTLGSRIVEIPTPPEGLAEDERNLIESGARMVAHHLDSLTERTRIFSQVAPLHPSNEMQQSLQKIFFSDEEADLGLSPNPE